MPNFDPSTNTKLPTPQPVQSPKVTLPTKKPNLNRPSISVPQRRSVDRSIPDFKLPLKQEHKQTKITIPTPIKQKPQDSPTIQYNVTQQSNISNSTPTSLELRGNKGLSGTPIQTPTKPASITEELATRLRTQNSKYLTIDDL